MVSRKHSVLLYCTDLNSTTIKRIIVYRMYDLIQLKLQALYMSCKPKAGLFEET